MMPNDPARGQNAGHLCRVRVFALGLVLLCAGALAQDLRVGYVDMKRLFDSAPQVVNAREALDREFRPRNESLLADEARLERLEAELAESTDLPSEQRLEREHEIRNLQRSIERRREDLREELRFRLKTRKDSLQETIDIAVNQVAEAGEFDLILTSPVAYASDRIDVTDRILDWLEEDYRGQQGSDGQAAGP